MKATHQYGDRSPMVTCEVQTSLNVSDILDTRGGGAIVARNALINLGGRVLPLAIAVVAIPVVIRRLGTADFGILSLAWVVFSWFGLLDIGVSPAITKYFAETAAERKLEPLKSLVWTGFAIQLVCAVAGMLVLWPSVPVITDVLLRVPPPARAETEAVLYWLISAIPPLLLSGSLRGILEALERFDLINAVSVPSSALGFLIPLGGGLAGWNIARIVMVLALSRYLVAAAYGGLILWLKPGLCRPARADWPTAKRLVSFGAWVSSTQALRRTVTSLDRILLARFAGLEAVAFYSAPYEIIHRFGIFAASVNGAAFPTFSRLSGEHRQAELAEAFERVGNLLLLLLGSVLCMVAIFAPPILELWLGKAFGSASTIVLQILAFGMLSAWFGGFAVTYLNAIGRPDIPGRIRIVVTLLELPLVFFLVRSYGIVGAASATAAGHLVNAVLVYAACMATDGVPSRAGLLRTAKLVASLVVFACVLYLCCLIAFPRLWMQAGGVGAIVIGMQLAMWTFVLDQPDRGLMIGLVTEVHSGITRSFPSLRRISFRRG